MFGMNHPFGVFFASLFFGFADAFSVRVQTVTDLDPNLVKLLPYLATLVVLTVIALRTKLALSMARRRFRAQLRDEQAVVPAEKTA
jgi:ABC-type uncharacterized transport system permease subunit